MSTLATESGLTYLSAQEAHAVTGVSCTKRDSRQVAFDPDRIISALRKCFASSCKLPQGEQDVLVEQITRRVVRQLLARRPATVGVEEVQRAVIAQLWGEGLADEAEHYQNYREQRRKERYNRPVSQAVSNRVKSDRGHFKTDLQYFQFMDKFSRWLPDQKRRETWEEAVFQRVLPFLFNRPKVKGKLTAEEMEFLGQYMYELKAGPAMRVVQMAGPALERCNVGVYNCSYLPIKDTQSFGELLYILMQGTGAGFSVEYEYVGDLPKVKRQTGEEKVTVVVEDTTESWCEALVNCLILLFAGRDFVLDTSRVRKKGARLKTKGGKACLTGDTVVYKDKKKATGENTLTIAQLYEKRVKTPRRLKHVKLRCLDEVTGTFQRNRVLDVIDNGIADVFEVTTARGYKIKATANHRFMSAARVYQHLDQFAVGELIAVNGAEVKTGRCEDCGVAVSRRATRCRPCADEVQIQPDANDTTARGRKACRAADVGECNVCGRNDLDTQVHHKDRDPKNNEPDNLLCVCEPCHRVLHAAEDTFGNPYSHKYLSFDEIVSITPAGRERVYDLCMEAPNHNFVANGFVSHNSGPEPLHELMDFVRGILLARQGRRLSDLDVHDICCMIGNIVQVGGVRRAALISLSDLNSRSMRDAKGGAWWANSKHRSMSNNSAVYHEKPTPEVFLDEWNALVRSKSGERGICNRQALERQCPERRKKGHEWGFNPCGEIQLRPYQFCNLSIAVARPDDTEETLTKKAVAAAYFGSIQATCTEFNYLRPEWKQNSEEESLLGVDITGHADCPLLFANNPDRDVMLVRIRQKVNEVNTNLAARFGINKSAADTCVKPSGDSAIFFDCGSGVSARFADCQWRYVRVSKEASIAKFLIDQGVPYANAPERPNELYVFGFLKEAPAGSIKRNDQTALDQLENWLRWKKNWAEHSVSATIYVQDCEWVAVGAWVYDHFDDITGLAFLPKDNGTYEYAPNVELTRDEFDAHAAVFPKVEWEKLSLYEDEDETGARMTFACVGGNCGD